MAVFSWQSFTITCGANSRAPAKIFLFRGHVRNPEAGGLATAPLAPFGVKGLDLRKRNHHRRLGCINQQPDRGIRRTTSSPRGGDGDHRQGGVPLRVSLLLDEVLDPAHIRIKPADRDPYRSASGPPVAFPSSRG